MKLLVDIGNTNTKAVVAEGGKLTAVDYHPQLFDQYAVSRLIYASVGQQGRATALIEQAQQAGATVVEVTTAAQAFGVGCGYANYQTLGIDRWLVVLGAAGEYPQHNVIVVDAGTATTVDFLGFDKVSGKQQHLGGWIVPGLALMSASVTRQTAKVFDDDDTGYQSGFGTTTPMALKSGCLAAQLGLIHQAVNDFDREALLLLCGGNGPLLLTHLKDLQPIHQPQLVFKGLNRF